MILFRRSVLAVACAQVIFAHAAQAQSTLDAKAASPSTGEVEHVLVTMPLHKGVAETALPFTVLSGEELRRNAAATIGDTLANLPGMTNASFGPGVGQPVIRGQQGPRVRVLQNGTSSADAARASQDHANAVEALLADTVEVLRGPSTLLYGGGAIGGVVNVLDNRIPTSLAEAPTGGIEYRHDTASSMDVVVGRFDTSSGPFALHIDAMHRDFDDLEIPGYAALEGVDEHDDDHDEDHGEDHDDDHEEGEHEEGERGRIGNTAGQASSFTLGGSYHFDKGFFGMSVSRLENEYGLPEGSHDHEHEDEHDEDHDEDHDEEHEGEEEEGGIILDMEQTRYDMALHLHDALPGIEIARTFVTYTDYEHAEIEGSGEVGTLYGNENLEARVELVHKSIGGFDGVIGFQASDGEFSAIGEEAFIPITDQREFGVFFVEDYHVHDRLLFEFGARIDSADRDPGAAGENQDFTAFSASASALRELNDEWTLGVALARAERAPTIEELFSNLGNDFDSLVIHAATGAYEVGNTDLDTEVSNNVDVSLRWKGEKHFASVQVYYNDFTDYINLVNTGIEIDEDPVREFVQEDAEFYGIEFDSRWALGEFAGGALRADVFGDFTYGELSNGDDVPRMPPRRLGARLAWDSASWSLWMRVLDAAEQDRAGMNETDTDGFTRWDAGAEYLADWGGQTLKLFLNVNNLTDEEIRLSTSFLRNVAPEAGFGVEAGIRLQF